MGKFEIGNSGRPVGIPNKRVEEWNQLSAMIVGQHAQQFNILLSDLFTSPDTDERVKGAMLYLNALEYFQPKLSRRDVNLNAQEPITAIEITVIRNEIKD